MKIADLAPKDQEHLLDTVAQLNFQRGLHKLSEKYKNYASQCDIDWPKTAASLRRVAKSYEEDAKREDERAKAWP